MLLRALTDRAPGWALRKDAERALSGEGDIDAIAPEAQWPAIRSTFASWAHERQLTPVVECTHVPNTLKLVGVEAGEHAALVELDVVCALRLRGVRLASADELAASTTLDERGFRALDAQAGAALLAARAKKLLGRTESFGAIAGSGRASLLLECRALAWLFAHPHDLFQLAVFDLGWRRRCALLRALRNDRQAPEDRARWLRHVARQHPFLDHAGRPLT